MSKGKFEKFDADMDIFQVHFRNNPIIPGVLLLMKGLQQREALAKHPMITVEYLTFNSFVRPGQVLNYVNDGPYTAISADSALSCSFSVRGGSETLISTPGSGELCQIQTPVSPAREPTYWFLPGQVNMNADGSLACAEINVEEVIRQHTYLTQISDSILLVLIEAAGNLALAMQQLRDDRTPIGRYIFVKFEMLKTTLLTARTVANLQIKTHVKRFGSIIAWDACVYDEGGVCLQIHNAISIKRTID